MYSTEKVGFDASAMIAACVGCMEFELSLFRLEVESEETGVMCWWYL